MSPAALAITKLLVAKAAPVMNFARQPVLETAGSVTVTPAAAFRINVLPLSAATNVSATATGASMLPAAADAWRTVGTSDVELYGITVANSATAGKARIVVTYSQNAALAAL